MAKIVKEETKIVEGERRKSGPEIDTNLDKESLPLIFHDNHQSKLYYLAYHRAIDHSSASAGIFCPKESHFVLIVV